MSENMGVPGYFPDDESFSAAKAQLLEEENIRLFTELRQELQRRKILSQTTTAQKNCVIEFMDEKGIRVLARKPAWFLGGYGSGDNNEYRLTTYAIDDTGKIYCRDGGIGERKEFRITGKEVLYDETSIGNTQQNIYILQRILSLPSWSALEEQEIT